MKFPEVRRNVKKVSLDASSIPVRVSPNHPSLEQVRTEGRLNESYAIALAVWMPGASKRLISLSFSDLLIIVLYFVMVLGIGIYLRQLREHLQRFLMAGREMTAWVAGLSFLSANLGALELMGGRHPPTSTASSLPISIGSRPSHPWSFLAW